MRWEVVMRSGMSGADLDPAWTPQDQLRETLGEIQCMWAHATSRGIAVPTATVHALDELIRKVGVDGSGPASAVSGTQADRWLADGTDKALEVHALFSALVAPAHPSSLSSNPPMSGLRDWVRQYPTIVLIAFFGFAGIVLFALFAANLIHQEVIGQARGGRILTPGADLACAGAAMLGSAFYSTFEASKYIVAQTYDSRYAGIYVIRFLLGITAGLILANFGNALIQPTTPAGDLGVATFALLGGYSADAVNSVLMRVSDTLSAAVKGRSDSEVASKDQQLRAAQTVADVQERRAMIATKQLEDKLRSPSGSAAAGSSAGAGQSLTH
jgi:hypothetical protein